MKLDGFAIIDNGEKSIARFRIACCSVDATPLTLRLDNSAQVESDNWYAVKGSFILQDGEYALVPIEITPIEQPENPYVF